MADVELFLKLLVSPAILHLFLTFPEISFLF